MWVVFNIVLLWQAIIFYPKVLHLILNKRMLTQRFLFVLFCFYPCYHFNFTWEKQFLQVEIPILGKNVDIFKKHIFKCFKDNLSLVFKIFLKLQEYKQHQLQSNGLKVCSPQVFVQQMLKPNPQCDDVGRWGLWEVVMTWGWSPREQDQCPCKRDSREFPCPLCHGRTQWDEISPDIWSWIPQLPELTEINFYCL